MSGSISTQYLMSSMTASITKAQLQLTTAQTESSTGQYADLGLQLGSESGYELSLKDQASVLQSFSHSNSILSTNLSVAQTALDSLRSNAQSALGSLTAWSAGSNSDATLQSLGANSLQSLIAGTNTTSNGQYVFGGINAGVAPMADYFSSPTSSAKTAVDQAFTSAFGFSPTSPSASTISASAIESFLNTTVSGQFQGSSWSNNWSSASSTNTKGIIAPGDTISSSVSANDPGFQKLAAAYTILTEFGGSSLSQPAQQAVASTAASLIAQGLSSMTNTEATVGAAQQSISQANDSMSSQLTILQTQIGNLDNVDQYLTATQVSELTTQIQTSYAMTARLQQLNLAQYLPVV